MIKIQFKQSMMGGNVDLHQELLKRRAFQTPKTHHSLNAKMRDLPMLRTADTNYCARSSYDVSRMQSR